jgi:hypothetical protein
MDLGSLLACPHCGHMGDAQCNCSILYGIDLDSIPLKKTERKKETLPIPQTKPKILEQPRITDYFSRSIKSECLQSS